MIDELKRIVVMRLDFAENQARRRRQPLLRDWQTKLDEFLRFNEREVLDGAGTVSSKAADEHARRKYDEFADGRCRLLRGAEGDGSGESPGAGEGRHHGSRPSSWLAAVPHPATRNRNRNRNRAR